MTKIDIFSGFLGAGKTTLIKKMISEGFQGEKLVLIENEFGEIGIDGGFLKDAGIHITEMNSGCICCSLVGDFSVALKKVLDEFHPDRILIEPSGVGKLSDVIKATKGIHDEHLVLNSYTAVVDVNKCKMYIKNFGEFFCDQIAHAKCIVLSHTDNSKEEKAAEAMALLRQHNPDAVIVSTPWEQLNTEQLKNAMEGISSMEHAMEELHHEHEHHHHHDENCACHHHHHEHDEHCHCHEHEHHHEHHHDHDEHCSCGHEHHHEGHHHADEIFQSFGTETAKQFTQEEITNILQSLTDGDKYGMVLRAKGIVAGTDGTWIHFDYIPGEPDVRTGTPDITGRICIIGANMQEDAVKELFGIA